MSLIDRIAEQVSQASYDTLSARTAENAKMHVLDTVGAMIAGAATQEGRVAGRLVSRLWPGGDLTAIGFPMRTSLLPAVAMTVAAARCTEVDDIHLASCTTPGSIIVPTALAFAREGLSDPRTFLAAVCAGYDAMVRLATAIDGAYVLYKGIWPTYFTAAFGAAAVSSRALNLDTEKTANALAAALSMSTGTSGKVKSHLPFRWLTAGVAAQNGVIAAFGAEEGMASDRLLLDRETGPIASVLARREELTNGLGERHLVDETGMKPFTVARQGLSAVEAFRRILAEEGVEPESIRHVRVLVPASTAAMIDNGRLPETRLESIVSVQYQMSLAALHPEGLLDVAHEPRTGDPRTGVLMARIRVEASTELERLFPAVWAATVEVATGKGVFVREVVYPKGDWQNPLTWEDLASKLAWVTGALLGRERTELLIGLAREMERARDMGELLRLLSADSL